MARRLTRLAVGSLMPVGSDPHSHWQGPRVHFGLSCQVSRYVRPCVPPNPPFPAALTDAMLLTVGSTHGGQQVVLRN